MQSKKRSKQEAMVNIAIGYTINYTANILLLPHLWHPDHPLLSAHAIGIVFTVISYIRQYALRRVFNKGDNDAG